MDMQKPGPRGRSSSINPGPRVAAECKTLGIARRGCWCLELTDALESRFEELRQYDRNFNESGDEATREDTSIFIDATRHDIEELFANEIYHKLTILLNNTRKKFGIQKGRPIDPSRKYDNCKLPDDEDLTFVYKRTVIDLGNINERLKAPWEIPKLCVAKLRSMGFTNITDEDI